MFVVNVAGMTGEIQAMVWDLIFEGTGGTILLRFGCLGKRNLRLVSPSTTCLTGSHDALHVPVKPST